MLSAQSAAYAVIRYRIHNECFALAGGTSLLKMGLILAAEILDGGKNRIRRRFAKPT
jgi:hypothetical protein